MCKQTNSRRRQAPVLIVMLTLMVSINTGAHASEEDTHTRNAFMLGYAYSNGFKVLSQNPTLPRKAKVVYDEWMSKAQWYAGTLEVTVNTSPVSSTMKQSEIIAAGARRMELLAIEVDNRRGRKAAAAIELGCKSPIAIEFLPYLTPSLQAETVSQYKALAAQMGIPIRIVEEYANTLMRTKDREKVVRAMLALRDSISRHYEDQTIKTPEGKRRQLNVWTMGLNLGLATLIQTQGADATKVEHMFEKSRILAKFFDIRVPMLPEATTNDPKDIAIAIHYLLNQAGDAVGGELKEKVGPRASSLFELAIKSVLTIILYVPEDDEDDMGQALADVIERTGKDAGLPKSTYQPAVDRIRSKSSQSAVKQEIMALHQRVKAFYSSEVPEVSHELGNQRTADEIPVVGNKLTWRGKLPSGWVGGSARQIEQFIRETDHEDLRKILQAMLSDARGIDVYFVYLDVIDATTRTLSTIRVNTLPEDFKLSDEANRKEMWQGFALLLQQEGADEAVTVVAGDRVTRTANRPAYEATFKTTEPGGGIVYHVLNIVELEEGGSHIFQLKTDGSKFKARRSDFQKLLDSVRYQ